MSRKNLEGLRDLSMLDLFRMEVETQATALTGGLLALERDANGSAELGELMRAAHSLKGAARIVGRKAAVRIAHAMEDAFVAAQKRKLRLSNRSIDVLLQGSDLLKSIASVSDDDLSKWESAHQIELDGFFAQLAVQPHDQNGAGEAVVAPSPAAPTASQAPPDVRLPTTPPVPPDRALRVTAENLTRLLGLAGEVHVSSRWIEGFTKEKFRQRNLQSEFAQSLEQLQEAWGQSLSGESAARILGELRDRANKLQGSVVQSLEELDRFSARLRALSARLTQEVVDCRMRPFGDALEGFPRMARDVARSLGKSVRLTIAGEVTKVDRDILEKLKAPLDHLVRNAIDHGIEGPVERSAIGKPEEGVVELRARHMAGILIVTVADDGRGIDLEAIRKAAIQQKLTTPEMAKKLSPAELMEFLFLPGFTLKESVTEISGRGIGLDVVRTVAREVGGNVRVSSERRAGTRFEFELPLTRSLLHALIAEIAGELYAFPLARVDRVLRVAKTEIESVEGRQYVELTGQQIGLIAAHQVLGLEPRSTPGSELSLLVISDGGAPYGLVVDRLLPERELVVRSLDPRLGKVRNIVAAALSPDGDPLLIVDVDDLIVSIQNLVSGQRLSQVWANSDRVEAKPRKRILVVDDSLTVRELQRKLLEARGFNIDIAVDGMDGWNAVRTGSYDLVVTDVDMPRMDGIDLIRLIRQDSRLATLPVMIVSYKDREEDRRRGLDAGADYYLPKSSFDDDTLVHAVVDLIGGADT